MKQVSRPTRITIGLMAFVICIPSFAGPCTTYIGDLRTGQGQVQATEQRRISDRINSVADISRQLSKTCWDQVVGLDVGSMGMPPTATRLLIQQLNEQCEKMVKQAVGQVNGAVSTVTNQANSTLGQAAGMFGSLQQSWTGLTSAEKTSALQALDALAPGAGAVFMQSQAGMTGMTMPTMATPGFNGSISNEAATSIAQSILQQAASFFSPGSSNAPQQN